MVHQKKIGPLSRKHPPLLVFHIDHVDVMGGAFVGGSNKDYFPGSDARHKWNEVADVIVAETKLKEGQIRASQMLNSSVRVGYFCDKCKCAYVFLSQDNGACQDEIILTAPRHPDRPG